MFSAELNSINNLQSDSFPFQFDALEFQYQLCQIFLKKTGEQLHQKQAVLMLESQYLMKKILLKDREKQVYSTDSGSQDHLTQRQNTIKDNLCLIKRGDGILWKKNQEKLAACLIQIEEKCSLLCTAQVKSIFNDCQHVCKKIWEIQVLQSIIQRKKLYFQREHQENIILKQKISSQSLKIQTLKCEIDCLKQKNETILDYANKKLKEMKGNKKLIQINSKVFKEIKNYLDDKERNIGYKIQRVQILQDNFLSHISNVLPNNSCNNCCVMLRKLKDSLINFKKYLQNQQNQLDGLYNKYKKTIFSQRNNKP